MQHAAFNLSLQKRHMNQYITNTQIANCMTCKGLLIRHKVFLPFLWSASLQGIQMCQGTCRHVKLVCRAPWCVVKQVCRSLHSDMSKLRALLSVWGFPSGGPFLESYHCIAHTLQTALSEHHLLLIGPHIIAVLRAVCFEHITICSR